MMLVGPDAYARAVTAGADFPTSLSPSRANDFLTCPLLFRLRSIDRLPELPSPAALRGTLVHAALERLFDLPAPERDVDAAALLLAEAWRTLADEDPQGAAVLTAELAVESDDPDVIASAVLAPARPLLEGYFSMEDPQRLQPHARELGVAVEIADAFTIRGFVDRIDRTDAGDVRIVDYKTGRSPRAGYESKALFQMRFYALAWWRMTGEVPRMLQLMYLGNREFLRYAPDVSELEATERKILAIRATINRAGLQGAFEPTPSRLCDWCAFRDLCPAFGGTPPPLPPIETWPASQAEPRDV